MTDRDPLVTLKFTLPLSAAHRLLVAFRELESLPPARRAEALVKCSARPVCTTCGLPLVDGPVPCPYCASEAVRALGREVAR